MLQVIISILKEYLPAAQESVGAVKSERHANPVVVNSLFFLLFLGRLRDRHLYNHCLLKPHMLRRGPTHLLLGLVALLVSLHFRIAVHGECVNMDENKAHTLSVTSDLQFFLTGIRAHNRCSECRC